MLNDLARALGQLGDRRFLGVMLLSGALTAVLLAGFVWAAMAALGWLLPEMVTLPLLGTIDLTGGWLSLAALLPLLLLSALLVGPAALAVMGLFLESIAAAVEARHYPGLPPVPAQPIAQVLGDALRFLGLVLVVNLLALVVYLLSTVLAPLVFWAVNGLLVGREYYQLVAARRLGHPEAARLRRRHRLEIWATGALLAVPMSVPLVGLFVPVIGVAAYTHQFHRHAAARQRRPG